MTKESLLYPIALTKIPKVGPVIARTLLGYCGSAEAVFRSSPRSLRKIPGIGEQLARSIVAPAVLQQAEAELAQLEREGLRALFFLDDDYPLRLKTLADAPLLLYVRGTPPLNAAHVIGIVGTRKPTPQGLAWCEELVAGLVPYQTLVVSGLAYGIDVAAHRQALAVGLPTVGVVAHGLGHLYPPGHRSHAERMAAQGGGLVSEYGFATGAEKEFFPMRNRIIAGLCDALVVVETQLYGGSMITAQFANDYHRDVFAVPGRPCDPLAAGCNALIKDNQAQMIERVDDLVSALSWDLAQRSGGRQGTLFVELEPEEKNIVALLHPSQEKGIDRLTLEAQKTHSEIAALLLQLEFKGLVRALPGKRYLLNG